jgi:nucleotide-binding universal stress UspA family protein
MERPFQRILVPVDFSPCSKEALSCALALAEAFQSELLPLHVLAGDLGLAAGRSPSLQIHFREIMKAEEEAAHREMAQFLEQSASTGRGKLLPPRFRTGSADLEILKLAEEWKADLIVMGTHGRRGISHLMLGSVTERVVRRAICPVLTVKSRHQT